MINKKQIIFIWTVILSPFFVVFSLVGLASFEFFGPLPTFDQLENPKSNLATEIISVDSVVIGKYFFENRTSALREDIPQDFINALLSTEDVRYREHSGIDVRALFRAVYGVLSGRSQLGGASTITQQVAKMLFTKQPASGLDRVKQKLKEWVITAKLERRYTKDEILLIYLNRYDWVNNAVGIESASRVYFNKLPKNLNIQESAMLVGMLKNSSLYNPNRRLELTQKRRNTVLYQMNKYEFVSDTLYDSLVQLPIILDFKKASHNSGLAPYFREYLRGEMKEWCSTKIKSDGSKYNLYTDGLKIYATIDSRLQKFTEEAVSTHLSELQKDFYRHWEGYPNAPFPEDFEPEQIEEIIDQAMRRSVRHKRLKGQGKTKGEIKNIFNTKVEMSLFSWNGRIDTVLSP
ncbi:MAG: transglycosylase domain-containing protein, partial [Flavobacteriales bacterium]|nr:transglycosylase domain-containing protein [Flavobacteriales bacterium]